MGPATTQPQSRGPWIGAGGGFKGLAIEEPHD